MLLIGLMTQTEKLNKKFNLRIKQTFAFLFLSAVLFSQSQVYAAGMSDVEIVVKEAVIEAQVYNPATGVPLTFNHIGFLNFGYNDRPNKCMLIVGGLILETEDYKSNPVMYFMVCVSKNVSGELKGEVLELYRQ